MKSVYTLECAICHERFKWRGKEWPKFCPKCGGSTALPERAEIQSPVIGKAKHKAPDQAYREYETATAANARDAASMLGVPDSEMSALKVTDFNGGGHEGELAVKPVSNPVTEFMQANSQVLTQVQAQAMGYAASAHTGPNAYAGASALAMVRANHQERAPSVVLSGQKVAKGEQRRMQPFASAVPTNEVIARAARGGGRTTY